MAHTCPDCGSYCNCGGDIDDIDLGIFTPGCVCCIDRHDDDDCDDDLELMEEETKLKILTGKP